MLIFENRCTIPRNYLFQEFFNSFFAQRVISLFGAVLNVLLVS